jgi:hypothetical protein
MSPKHKYTLRAYEVSSIWYSHAIVFDIIAVFINVKRIYKIQVDAQNSTQPSIPYISCSRVPNQHSIAPCRRHLRYPSLIFDLLRQLPAFDVTSQQAHLFKLSFTAEVK